MRGVKFKIPAKEITPNAMGEVLTKRLDWPELKALAKLIEAGKMEEVGQEVMKRVWAIVEDGE